MYKSPEKELAPKPPQPRKLSPKWILHGVRRGWRVCGRLRCVVGGVWGEGKAATPEQPIKRATTVQECLMMYKAC